MNVEFKSFKYRLYPNLKQKKKIDFYLEANRNAYNYFLIKSIEFLKNNNCVLTNLNMLDELQAYVSSQDKYSTLDRSSFIYTIKEVEKNIQKFNNGYSKEPKIKDENSHYYACKIKNNYSNVNIGKKINISEIKEIKFKGTIVLSGQILNVTLSKSPTNKYYASFLCKNSQHKPFEKTFKSIGIDAGFMNLATLSDNTIYENSSEYKKSIKRIAYEKKKISKMKKGSNRYKKQRLKIAILYERTRNRRNDNLHKMTTEIVKKYDDIHVETLKTNRMIESSKSPEKIYDASWYETQRMLEYKCKWNYKNYIKVPVYYPSSQKCSNCGYINKNIKDITIKKWICPNCNAVHNRDINAAKNILNYK